MIVVQRTHELRRDLDWFPSGTRRSGWLATAAACGGAVLACIGTAIVVPVPELAAISWFGYAIGAAVTGERARRALSRRHLARMAQGEEHLAAVDRREEGELVVVHGTVDADETLTGVLGPGRGVYRRMTFLAMQKHWVHEAAVDFSLIGDDGSRILIQGGGARWLMPPVELRSYADRELDREGMPRPVRDLIQRNYADYVAAAERILAVGTRVRIVGYKTSTADVTGEAQGYRAAPQRATLRSGPHLPLVITVEVPATK